MGPHDARPGQDITVTITEREAAIIGLGLAHGALDGLFEPGDALRVYDKIITASGRLASFMAVMPPDVRKRYEERNPH